MNRNRDDFSSVRVGAYGIRHTNEHIRGRTNRNRDDFSFVRVGAYGIRPTNEHIGGQTNRKKTGSVVHLFTYNGERVNQYVPSLPFDEIMGAYAIRPYPDGRKGGVFFIRCRSEKSCLGGDRLLLFVGKMKIEDFGCRYFYVTRNGRINMSARYFLMELWGRMQYAPTLTDEKGAFSLSVVGRGRDVLAGAGFFYL